MEVNLMGRYKNSGLFHGTNGNRQTSIEQTNYDGKLKNLSKKKFYIMKNYLKSSMKIKKL